MRRTILILSTATALSAVASPARAQDADATANRAITSACDGFAGQTLTRERLADALVYEARVGSSLGEMAEIAAEIAQKGTSERINSEYYFALRALQSGLARPGSEEAAIVEVSPAPPQIGSQDADWLFSPDYQLRCAEEGPASQSKLSPIVIRGTVDALMDEDDDRVTAPPAQVGWERTRVTTIEGETTRTETFTVNATLAYAFRDVLDFAAVYADYSRNRIETRTEGAAEVAVDDVEAFELGLTGNVGLGNLEASGRVAVTFDEVSKARYLRGNLTLVPITGGRGTLGICGLNSFDDIGFGLQARCTLAAEAEIRDVLNRGAAPIGDTDVFAALGGSIGFEVGRSLDVNGDAQDGFVGSARYTYLAVVNGDVPDIDRLDASLAYRWWMDKIGFDVGLSYADGTERKSFSDENRLGFRIGIIY